MPYASRPYSATPEPGESKLSGVLTPLTPGRRMLYAGRQVPQKPPVLDVSEIDSLSAGFGDLFDAECEHVIDATVTAEARVGADWHPAPLLVGLRQVHGQIARQRISGAPDMAARSRC